MQHTSFCNSLLLTLSHTQSLFFLDVQHVYVSKKPVLQVIMRYYASVAWRASLGACPCREDRPFLGAYQSREDRPCRAGAPFPAACPFRGAACPWAAGASPSAVSCPSEGPCPGVESTRRRSESCLAENTWWEGNEWRGPQMQLSFQWIPLVRFSNARSLLGPIC